MGSYCRRFISKSSLSSIKSAIKSNAPKSPSRPPSPPSSSAPRRISFTSRSPFELGGVQSLLPLHSTVAAARMTSCLSTTSRNCRALSQELGLSVPR
ncbi:protein NONRESPONDING TO OXYLIPINS 2, mitochondrial isoform X2 [Mercurialis annua]|uniref:protein NONRESPONDING TO OXYLIPINS 2, mitochondrial isoform X2 n=1 Tax=Mercurialis annua TaxID=3986 RepID=UPI002160E077|nr:protein NONRESPONDING TO OXYLIPINS 2, mitochondrial isoform X2 [Mercurialis annua]